MKKLLILTMLISMVPVAISCTATSEKNIIEVISVTGPVPPYTPGGPTIKIVLKNVSTRPVISLTAELEIPRNTTLPFDHDVSLQFNYDVSEQNPMMPGESSSATSILIGPKGFDNNVMYSLKVHGSLKDEQTFNYTTETEIMPPSGE